MAAPLLNWPIGKYGAILADPPWRFETYNEEGRNRCPDWRPFKDSPSRHYDTMTTDDIAVLPVEQIAADDCALFLWISWPMLEDALRIIRAWSFTYKTCAFCWIKANATQMDMFTDDYPVRIGAGYWSRSNSEVCLLATRGKPKRLHADVRQGIIAPRREHSRKPEIHDRIERLVGGPFVELFARQQRIGWTTWGNETEKFT